MRVWSIVGMALATLCTCLAEDFWVSRAPETWSALEIKQIVSDSPWAKPAAVRMRNGLTSAPEILVRWDSAVPILEACSHGGMERHLFTCASKLLYLSGLGEKFDALRTHYYVIGISNYPKPQRREGDPPEHSEAGDAALARMSRRIQETTFLRRAGKSASKPEQVVALPAGQSLLLMVVFSRTPALSLDDEHVEFDLADDTMEVKATFHLKEMMFRGRLEL